MTEEEQLQRCRVIIDYLKSVCDEHGPLLIAEDGLERLRQKKARRQLAHLLQGLTDWALHLEVKDRNAIDAIMVGKGYEPFLAPLDGKADCLEDSV
jgi:hypothetical protein